MSARCCWPHSPSKKQLGTIIATYKWISSMIKMFRVGGDQDTQPGGCNLDGGPRGLCSKRAKERKTCWAVYLGTRASGQVLLLPPLARCSTQQQRHLSLNTALMKVIHFNGASFQTLAIKACGALVWEVVETVWVPVLQINSSPRKPASIWTAQSSSQWKDKKAVQRGGEIQTMLANENHI